MITADEVLAALKRVGLEGRLSSHAPVPEVRVTNASGHEYMVRLMKDGCAVVAAVSQRAAPTWCATVDEVLAELQRAKPRSPAIPPGMN